MKDLACLCGNRDDVSDLFQQNFDPEEVTASNFSARGKHAYERRHLHYRIVRCRKCGQVFSTPVLEAGAIERLYQKSLQTYTREMANIASTYLKPLQRWMGELPSRDGALEIGCGSGYCLQALRDLGFRTLRGIEPSEDAVSQADDSVRPWIANRPFEKVAFAGERFDLVCAFQVLDHFLDPVRVVRTVYDLLRPGGLFYAIIHDVSALQVKLLGDRSPIIDVSHIYYFDRQSLRRLLETNGFEVLDLFRIWNTYTIAMWMDMAPLPFKSVVTRFLDRTGISGWKATIPAGNIGIIGRRRP